MSPSPEDTASAGDREAIRQLHHQFMGMIGQQRFEAIAHLFVEGARLRLAGADLTGRPAIDEFFRTQYRQQAATTLHSAYRQPAAPRDSVQISTDRLNALAISHVEVALSTPLRGESTLVQMARLQGQVASRRWQAGRFESRCVKVAGQWKLASLDYLPVQA